MGTYPFITFMNAPTPAEPTTPESSQHTNQFLPHYTGRIVSFENIPIAWDKYRWHFENLSHRRQTIDVYSVWNPGHWSEIAKRFAEGQIGATFIAGNFAVCQMRKFDRFKTDTEKNAKFDPLFDGIKLRPISQNGCAFVHPDDQSDLIDLDRLPANHRKHFASAENRMAAHAWAQHNIFPANMHLGIDNAWVRQEDQTIACIWIPRHFGYEGIARALKKLHPKGVLGGTSLNIHNGSPSFTLEQLYEQISHYPNWQQHIDFIVDDELLRASGIDRSQPMVSFTQEQPYLVREGAASLAFINERTGFHVVKHDKATQAASATPYNDEANAAIDAKIILTEKRVERFHAYLRGMGYPV